MSRSCAASSGPSGWIGHLPFVLLGLRTAIREDSNCAASDLLYGGHLRLPGNLVSPSPLGPPPSAVDFVAGLRSSMVSSAPMPVVHHGVQPSRVDPLLERASHVFMRVDAVRPPLVPPYDGPFPVLSRGAKTFDILWREKPYTVSVDRLKPARLLPDAGAAPASPIAPRPSPPSPLQPSPSSSPPPPSTPSPALVPSSRPLYSEVAAGGARPSVPVTRSGRLSRPVDRLQLPLH